MKTPLLALVVLAALAAPLNAGPAPGPTAVFVNPDQPEAAEIARLGESAISRLAVTLNRELAVALAKGTPEQAVDVCHLKALPVTGGTVAGLPRILALKRTSLRIRNPANAPDAADDLALARIQAELESGNQPSKLLVQRIDSPGASAPEWRVYRPIGVASQCLVCHGDPATQSPALRAKLQGLYPDDAATGYTAGEWRGLIRVSVDRAPTAKPAPKKS